jgi:uncharacterized protein involved in exopolysaccharide biosynthesis
LNPTYTERGRMKREEEIQHLGFSSAADNDTPVGNGTAKAGMPMQIAFSLWQDRRFIVKAFFLGTIVAAIISFLIRPEYEATMRLMPPEKQGLGGLAAMLAGGDDKTGSLVGGLMSSAAGLKSSGALSIGVLKSATLQDDIIRQFDLRKVYSKRYQMDARQELSDRTDFDEDRKSGIIAITVRDRSPSRAMQIAQAYGDDLGRLMATLDTSAAHRERVFLEDRLAQVKEGLDIDAKALSDFSGKNLTLDVKEQGKAMMTGAVALEGQLVALETELSGLEQIYAPNNVRIRSMQGRVNELRKKLAEIKGNADIPEDVGGGEFGVSIAHLPQVGLAYTDLYRSARIQEAVFETLTKQYELAKIEEAKSVPSIKILDPALLPEKKSSPKRTLITLFGGVFAAIVAAIYVMTSSQLKVINQSHPLGQLGSEVKAGLRRDWEWIRSHLPESLGGSSPPLP